MKEAAFCSYWNGYLLWIWITFPPCNAYFKTLCTYRIFFIHYIGILYSICSDKGSHFTINKVTIVMEFISFLTFPTVVMLRAWLKGGVAFWKLSYRYGSVTAQSGMWPKLIRLSQCPTQGSISSNQSAIHVLFLPTHSIRVSRNQVVEMGVVPLTTTRSDPLAKTLLIRHYGLILCWYRGLSSKERNTSTGRHNKDVNCWTGN